jgi:hypothetical protein
MALNYSSKHDISYASYNNKTIPWKVNTSIISQNNQNTNPSLNLGTINNNLVIESSQNDILFITSQNDNDNENKKVIVKNNMDVDVDLDVSNNLTTKLNVSYDISLNNILYFPSLPVNIIGDLKVRGAISVLGKTTPGLVKSESQFVNVTLSGGRFTDVSIVSSTISVSDFSNVNIINSYINDISNGFGYDKSNNALPNKAIFSDVSLQSLILDSSINSSYINFANNTSNAISIRSSADYSKLVISKPLNVGTETITNISNVSIFYGDISCNNLYYSRLVPDVKLNNYSDVSIGEVSISGNNVPTSNMGINIGSNAYKFNNTYSTYFNGDLSGTATLANNLIKNLDMSFNNLDICGTITLNKLNLNQFLSSDLTSIVDGNSSFITISNKVRDLSASVYTKSDFDLCLNTHITKISLLETSFVMLNGNITSISNSVYSKSDFDLCLNTHITKISLLETSFVMLNGNLTSISNSVYSKSDFDLCLNRNILRISDVSAIASVVSTPPIIYPTLGYNDNLSIKQTNAKVSNELAFPYAITYIDDVTEDTNLKEDYSYRMTTSQIKEIYTTLNIINTTYTSSVVQVPVAGAQPNHINNTRVSMWFVNGATAPKLNSWMADDGTTLKPAVYINLMTASPRVVLSYQVNRSSMTWEQHRLEAQQVRGRFLASILNSTEQTTVHNLIGTGSVWLGGRRRSDATSTNPNNSSSTNWEWVSGDGWSYTNFFQGTSNSEPSQFNQTALLIRAGGSDGGVWNDENSNLTYGAVYMTLQMNSLFEYQINTTPMTWAAHKLNAETVRHRYLATIENSNQNTQVAECIANMSVSNQDYKRSVGSYIGGRRKAGSINAYGITSTDWEWTNGTTWNNTNYFYLGGQTQPETIFTPNPSTTTQEAPVFISSTPYGTPQIDNFNVSNVKIPCLISSLNGSITVTATSIGTLSLPPKPNDISSSTSTNSGTSTINDYRSEYTTTTTKIITSVTYSLNSGLTTGSFKISENTNNTSNYITRSSNINTTIPTTYSCIAITNDGMFVALGKASDVTVYIKNSNGWATIGSSIGVNFSTYTETSVGIIPTQFTDNWRKNLQNLAINFNYFSGSTTSQLILAFGDSRTSIKVYSYSGGSWSFSNGSYSVAGGTWGSTFLRAHNATTAEINSNNFGYFVTLSQSPSILGFTVANNFYTYNCTTSDGSQRGTVQTLVSSHNYYTNIIAFKMSSDAEKIIVSNTYYVFIYKWNITDWTIITNAIINLVSAAITFTYPNTSTTPIPAGPRSLDISNISSDECIFAIGFPDKLIDTSSNRKARGYVEYWKYSNAIATRLATLVPRKRNIDNSNVDTDEYFFSAGGIKITNANTILVAPNFKFHLSSTNKIYTLSQNSLNWATHNNSSNAKAIVGREMASIENEADNELVKVSARNNNVWIGATRISNISTGITSSDWAWSDPSSIWNYTSFNSGEPNRFAETRIQSLSGTWYDTDQFITMKAVYMTRLQYSLNTFTIFNNFFLHLSGFSSSYANTDIATAVIAKWVRTDSPSTQPIEFRGNGNIMRNSQGSFTTSDIRLKENIVDASPKLVDLLKVRVVNYNLKGSDGTKLIGVVAQELETIFPTLVNNGELSPHDTYLGKTESYKSVKYSCFDVILIKAFQEQMAIINKLSAQLDDLECKTKSLKTISQEHAILKQDLEFLKRENELFKLNINEITMLMAKC